MSADDQPLTVTLSRAQLEAREPQPEATARAN